MFDDIFVNPPANQKDIAVILEEVKEKKQKYIELSDRLNDGENVDDLIQGLEVIKEENSNSPDIAKKIGLANMIKKNISLDDHKIFPEIEN